MVPATKWPRQGDSEFEQLKYIENIFLKNLLQNHLTQMLKIWYVALPSGHLPSFVQMKVPGSRKGSSPRGPGFEA